MENLICALNKQFLKGEGFIYIVTQVTKLVWIGYNSIVRRNHFFRFLLNILFPPRCAGCKNAGEFSESVCISCRTGMPLFYFAHCPTCKHRIPGPPIHPHAPYVLVAVTHFKNPAIQNIIHNLKYKREKTLALFCGNLLAESASRFFEIFPTDTSSCVAVPVPLHPHRMRERGFNQSEAIASVFLKRLATIGYTFHLATNLLVRTLNTPSQVGRKSRKERIKNLQGCFSVSDPTEVKNKTVLLIDDVSTTGATLQEATTALRSAGARRVIAFVIAKTD